METEFKGMMNSESRKRQEERLAPKLIEQPELLVNTTVTPIPAEALVPASILVSRMIQAEVRREIREGK